MSQIIFTEERRSVLGALIGLARATEGNEHLLRPSTYELCCKALLALDSGTGLEALVGELHDEKFRIVPDCAVCQSPCGRTFDYTDDLTPIKQELLNTLILAVRNSDCVDGDCHVLPSFLLYRSLYALGSDWDEPDLKEIIKELN